MLEVSQLSASYGSVRVLHDVWLSVGSGEFCAVLGANGAGKTTLLRSLIGVQRASGSIKVGGKEMVRSASWRRVHAGLSLCPEGRRLFPGLSVRENIELALRAVGRAQDTEAELEEMVSLFPRLGERMSQLAGSLSGGEQQMCAIARALVARPRVLMLDEPSLGLAPVVVRQVFDALAAVNESGIGVLLVEQNAALALELAHRAYVLERGRVVLEGEAQELAKDPRVRAAYLGLSDVVETGASAQ